MTALANLLAYLREGEVTEHNGPPESTLPGAQWVRVEFYGLVPFGQVVTGLDPAEVGQTLMRSFGFTHIDGLTVVAEPPKKIEIIPLQPKTRDAFGRRRRK